MHACVIILDLAPRPVMILVRPRMFDMIMIMISIGHDHVALEFWAGRYRGTGARAHALARVPGLPYMATGHGIQPALRASQLQLSLQLATGGPGLRCRWVAIAAPAAVSDEGGRSARV